MATFAAILSKLRPAACSACTGVRSHATTGVRATALWRAACLPNHGAAFAAPATTAARAAFTSTAAQRPSRRASGRRSLPANNQPRGTQARAAELDELKRFREAQAKQMQVRGSHKRLTMMARAVTNLPVVEALAQLEVSKKRVSGIVGKIIGVAAANARNQHGLEPEDLYVAVAQAAPAGYTKKPSFRARGRVDLVKSRYGHLRVVVRELPSVLLERAQEAARAAGPGVPVDARTAEVVRKTRRAMMNARRYKYK